MRNIYNLAKNTDALSRLVFTKIMKRAKSSATSKTQKKTKLVDSMETSVATRTTEDASTISSSNANFAAAVQEQRLLAAENVIEFPFKKRRVRILTTAEEVKEHSAGGILYWMSRDARVQDNWALLFAQKLALKMRWPLVVAFCLVPKFLNATIRHYKFMLGGLEEVEKDLQELNIPFYLLLGPAAEHIPKFVKEYDIGAVVCDFAPLRVPRKWIDDVKDLLPKDIPLTQVDAHNIVPVWIASDKQEYAARTIRNKINSKLSEYLTEFPPIVKHPYEVKQKHTKVNWKDAYASLKCDMSVDAVDWAKPGYKAALKQLHEFCTKRLRIFNDKRNDPTLNALSGLSPWFHFGHISVQRCILEVKRFATKHKASVDAFCEEAIVRRELADNFCYYNDNYDNIKGLHEWARKTLDEHRKDKRSSVYTLTEFEQARTHDDLWNSAQLQLINEGKMHGFLRMYWAKKILEWTETPEQALEFAILLNDKYSLDGRDPNGYVGCMWSIGGVHDQGWAERPIFGKIRYMNYQGCKRKFDINTFVARYGGKVYTKST